MYPIPQYINSPLRYFLFDIDEIAILFLGVAISMIAKSLPIFLILMSLILLAIRKKRKSPPGYLKHLLYFIGLYNMEYYPEYVEQEFLE